MFKFLRKYNKWILAVGGTILMVVFLVPQAITALSQQAASSGATWASIDGEDVSADTRRQCEQELQILESLQRFAPQLAITDRPEHWYLLVREAELAGFTGARGSDLLPQETMNGLYSIAGQSSVVDDAVGKRLAINRLFEMYQLAGKFSDHRLRGLSEQLLHAIDGRAVVLTAEADDTLPEPDATAIASQFDEYQDVFPTDNEQGFGYRLPDRFKLEYLIVRAANVRAMIEASGDIDGVALFQHWKRYETDRNFPPVEAVSVPDVVREDLLKDRTNDKLTEIEKFAFDRLLRTWMPLGQGDSGHRELPDDWATKRVDLAALAKEMQANFPGLELPSYRAIGDRWLGVEDLTEFVDLDTTGTERFGDRVGLGRMIVGAKEFSTDDANNILFQQGISEALRRADDNSLVLVRLTDTDASRPPHDVDEVRDAVVADLRRLADFDRLVAKIDSLGAEARTNGLLAMAIANDADVQNLERLSLYDARLLQFQMRNNLQLTAQPSPLPLIGTHEETTRKIIDHALSLPRDIPTLDLPLSDRIMSLTVEDKLAVMVLELTNQYPLSLEQFDQLAQNGALQQILVNQELDEASPPISEVFGFEALAERHDFELKGVTDVDEDADSTDDDEADDTAAASAG